MPLSVIHEVSTLTLALIAAGAAIGGSLIGGVVTGWFGLRAERKRQEFARETDRHQRDHEEAQERKLAKGAAREIRRGLRRAATVVQDARDQRRWWWADDAFPLGSNVEERKLLSFLMTPEQWDTIEKAEAALERVAMVRKATVELGKREIAYGETSVDSAFNFVAAEDAVANSDLYADDFQLNLESALSNVLKDLRPAINALDLFAGVPPPSQPESLPDSLPR